MRPNPTDAALLDPTWTYEPLDETPGLAGTVTAARAAAAAGEVTALHLLWALFDEVVRIDPARPRDVDRDRIVLGERAVSPGVLAMLAAKGFAPLDTARRGADARAGAPGIEVLAGTPGDALAEGAGLALALRLLRRGAPRVFAVMADGPWGEPFHDVAGLAIRRRLDNLAVAIHARARATGDTAARLRSIGWHARVVDGRDPAAIREGLLPRGDGRPVAVVAVGGAVAAPRAGRG